MKPRLPRTRSLVSRCRLVPLVSLLCAVGCREVLGFHELTFETVCGDSSAGCGGASVGSGGTVAAGGVAGDDEPTAGSGDAGGPEVPECTTHGECIEAHVGEPYICREARCVGLKNYGPDRSGDCRVVLGANNLSEHGEPYIFGAFSKIDPLTPESSPLTHNYKFAIEQFSGEGGILIGGKSRLPVLVVCDDGGEELERLDATFDHLVETVGVSAIITPIEGPALRSSFERLRDRGKEVFFLSPYPSTNVVTTIEDGGTAATPGLVWHLLPKPTDIARTYVPLVARVESFLRARSVAPPLRLALVESGPNSVGEMAPFLDAQLRFNGKTPRENAPAHYLRVAVEHPNALDELMKFRAHIVVSAADLSFVPLMSQLEREVLRLAVDPKPFYVLSDRQAFDSRLPGLVSGHPGLQERLVGVKYASAEDSRLYDAYLSDIQSRFPLDLELQNSENFYDAVYYLLYAASAGGAERGKTAVTGFDTALGMWRLLEGAERVDVGPQALANALRYLADAPLHEITLHGTLGPPNFDRATGGRSGIGSVWCITRDAQFQHPFVYDTLFYDPESHTLTGTLECFDDF